MGDADHHGQDAGRDTLNTDEAQRTAGGLGPGYEQTEPSMAQNNASTLEKITGIAAQTRVDVGGESQDRIVHVLRQRLDEAGIALPDADVDELARQISA